MNDNTEGIHDEKHLEDLLGGAFPPEHSPLRGIGKIYVFFAGHASYLLSPWIILVFSSPSALEPLHSFRNPIGKL